MESLSQSQKVLLCLAEYLEARKRKKAKLAPAIAAASVQIGWHEGSVRNWTRTLRAAGYINVDHNGNFSLTDQGLVWLGTFRPRGQPTLRGTEWPDDEERT